MGTHKVNIMCGGKNEMWGLIPQNAPRRGSVSMEAEPWKRGSGVLPPRKFLEFTCKMVTSGEF